jgi:hypothetical protein
VTILGGLLAVWGAVVLAIAPMLHRNWKGMLAGMRRSGIQDTIWGTEFFASTQGLRRMRIAGALALVVGLVLVAIGVARG